MRPDQNEIPHPLRLPTNRQFVWISLKDSLRTMRACEIPILASSLAFGSAISLVPVLILSLSVFYFYGNLEDLYQLVERFLLRNLAEGAGAEVARTLHAAVGRAQSVRWGLTGALSLLIASTKIFFDVERAVEKVWQVKKTSRSLILRLLVYWVIIFLGPLILGIVLAFFFSKDLGVFTLFPKGTISFIVILFALFAFYKWAPSPYLRSRYAFASALMADISIAIMQRGYGFIMRKILSYNRVYGSLASIPIFLLWISVFWWICLAGVAFCASLQRQHEALEKPN
jgi:membrane protein